MSITALECLTGKRVMMFFRDSKGFVFNRVTGKLVKSHKGYHITQSNGDFTYINDNLTLVKAYPHDDLPGVTVLDVSIN